MLDDKQILRSKDLIKILKLSRSTIWRRVKIGNFPKPFVLGGNNSSNSAVGWLAADIYSWIEKQKILTETKKGTGLPAIL